MAGQSNMAGRSILEPEDTVSNKRILSINIEMLSGLFLISVLQKKADEQIIMPKELLVNKRLKRQRRSFGFCFRRARDDGKTIG